MCPAQNVRAVSRVFFFACAAGSPACSGAPPRLSRLPPPAAITASTVYEAPLVIEGLTGDAAGNLYVAGRAGSPACPVWRVAAFRAGGAPAKPTVVGSLPAPCSPSGLAFDAAGRLFVADGARVYVLTPDEQSPPTASVYASGVPGANGLAFDRAGDLWVTDGTTGQGRVWRIGADGRVTEAFRVQPLANDARAEADVDGGGRRGGVGRDARALPPGSVTLSAPTRTAADAAGSVDIVANGIAFAPDGTLYVADTARGAIWRVAFDARGGVRSPVGCDATFPPDTLCLDDVFVQHPALEGIDGIALDSEGDVWSVANERNAVVVVTAAGAVREVFRDPPDARTHLRNEGPLEFPTSPFFVGRRLCITQSDANRRDNSPNTGGEVGPQAPGPALGKISCLVPPMPWPGAPLPVR